MIDPLGSDISSTNLLSTFLQAENERESEECLDKLFSQKLSPVIEKVLRRKMGVSLSPDDTSANNLDALELASDIETQLLRTFRILKENRNTNEIANPEAYSRAVATNTFRQYLRDKYPQRERLRNKIKYILRNKKSYALWNANAGDPVCGLSAWTENSRPPAQGHDLEEIRATLETRHSGIFAKDDNRGILIVMKEVFEQVDAPIRLNDLVSLIAGMLGLEESVVEEINENSVVDRSEPEVRVVERLSLQLVWNEIVKMPTRHRTALLLNMRGEHGENILAFIPMLRIASIRKIADVLEMDPEELAALWHKLPLDDQSIAERLSLTRQQVINLRQSASRKPAENEEIRK